MLMLTANFSFLFFLLVTRGYPGYPRVTCRVSKRKMH